MANDEKLPPDENSLSHTEDAAPISQVNPEVKKKPVPMPVLIGILVVIVLVSAVVLTSGKEKKKPEENGVNFSGEAYTVRNTPTPFPNKDELPKPDLGNASTTSAGATSEGTRAPQTAEEKQRQKQEEDLELRRKHSPVVIVNKVTGQENTTKREGSMGDLHDIAKEKMDRLEQSTQQALSQLNEGGDHKDDGMMKPIHSEKVEEVQATLMENRGYMVAQGKMIGGVLETAINSDLPGMLRAVVSESVYSEDGNSLLIPKGSRVVGEYRSGLQRGQTRIFVIWTRLIRPDGIDVKIDSPGTDALGGSGLSGDVDTHFMERFGASALMSLISGYAQSNASNDRQVVALSDSFSKSSEIALQNSINIPPTVHINQGEPINIFVAKDLDFKQALLTKERHLKGF